MSGELGDAGTFIAAIAAVVAAVISWKTYQWQVRADRVDVRVELALVNRVEENGVNPSTLVVVNATNHGKIPVELEGCWFILTDHPEMKDIYPNSLQGDKLPCILYPGRKLQHLDSASRLVQLIRKLGLTGTTMVTALYRDALKREYQSEPFAFDLDHDYDAVGLVEGEGTDTDDEGRLSQ